MPNWNEILDEVRAAGSTDDVVRRQYLSRLQERTGRNVIAYYSAWLQKEQAAGVSIADEDKNGFMAVIHEMDRSLGLDLILHTPGGDLAATESLVDYLRSMFDTDIRVIVPQIAMSGGTMMACAAKEIVMGKHSNLGPIDPQFAGVAAHGVVEEFSRARNEVKNDPSSVHIWQPIIAKYPPTFIGDCEKAIAWSEEITREWLRTGMFKDLEDSDTRINTIIQELGDHALTKSHKRHISADQCEKLGLNIQRLESQQDFQEAVLSVHHACMLTFTRTPAVKIIENHTGTAFIKLERQMVVQAPPNLRLQE